nr:MAG TPA_asm: hypothetical protein [Caudoviricetes sp.]
MPICTVNPGIKPGEGINSLPFYLLIFKTCKE